MNKVNNWVFGSMFRTLGRILCYFVIGFLLIYFGYNLPDNWKNKLSSIFGFSVVYADSTELYITGLSYYTSIPESDNIYGSFSYNGTNYNILDRLASGWVSGYFVLYNSTSEDMLFIGSKNYSNYELNNSTISFDTNNIFYNNSSFRGHSKLLYYFTNHSYDNFSFNISGFSDTNNSKIDISSLDLSYNTYYRSAANSNLNFVSYLNDSSWCVLKYDFSSFTDVSLSSDFNYCSSSGPDISYDPVLFNSDFFIFYTFSDISDFNIFSSFDFSTFTDYQKLVITFVVNIFYLIFIFVCVYLIIKVINKLITWLF